MSCISEKGEREQVKRKRKIKSEVWVHPQHAHEFYVVYWTHKYERKREFNNPSVNKAYTADCKEPSWML